MGDARQSSRCLGERRRGPDLGDGRLWRKHARFATLLKQGWKPRRTIIYCVWDGEEPALLGSTEWGETHADELRHHAVAYINSDGNGRGYLSMGGSHSLEKFINGVARDIQDPEKKIPVWKRDQLKAIADAKTPEERKEARERADLRINALGSGSDWTVFLDHLGIASLDLAYGDEDGGGIYHSIYDDFYWYTHFSDTDFSYGRALSQTRGPRSCDSPTPTCCPIVSRTWPTRSIVTSMNCKNS